MDTATHVRANSSNDRDSGMDALLVDILSWLGITGEVGIVLAFVLKEMFTRNADGIRKS